VSILAKNKHEDIMFLKLNTVGVRGSGIGEKRNKKKQIEMPTKMKLRSQNTSLKIEKKRQSYKLLHEAVDYLMRGLK
jgi:hypothetical protein